MVSTITVDELAQFLQTGGVQVIDVRSPGEFNAGHVPGAVNIPLEQVETRIGDLGDQSIAVVCHSGTRASVACDTLLKHRPQVLLLQGGTKAWIGAGRNVVSSTNSSWSIERQVRLVAGLIVLISSALSIVVNPSWAFLTMFVGAGLTVAGLTNFCGMGILLAKMPWNRSRSCASVNEVRA